MMLSSRTFRAVNVAQLGLFETHNVRTCDLQTGVRYTISQRLVIFDISRRTYVAKCCQKDAVFK